MAEKKFSGREFKVDQVLATDAIRLKFELLQILGDGVDKLPVILAGRGKDKTTEQKAASDAAAVDALQGIIAKLEPETVIDLMNKVLDLSQVKRASGAWETPLLDGDFTQHKGDLYPVLLFVLRETFSDFFTGLKGNGKLQELMNNL